MIPDLLSDPFGEHSSWLVRRRLQLLGGRFQFRSNSTRLLELVDAAYDGVPAHRLSARVPDLILDLQLTKGDPGGGRARPPPLTMLNGAGCLGGATVGSSFTVLSPQTRTGLVVVSPRMLPFPYHVRYELIEFAVFTLAARAQQLVPLHAACIGRDGHGLLLIGPSGSGKSTLSLHWLLQGHEFLAEDSVFVTPDTMLATGIANFLHVCADSLRWLKRSRAAAIAKSPVIRRRSGVRKFEVDLRRGNYRIAPAPLKIIGSVFISAREARSAPLLRALPRSEMISRLTAAQAYAASQPQWRKFVANLSRLGAFELRRGRHPLEAVEALQTLLRSNAVKAHRR